MQFRVQQDLPSIHQGILLKQLKNIFPNDEIFQNSRKQSTLKYPTSNAFLEFDIWIPTLHLCFEFQDAYHYVTTWYYQNTKSRVAQRDSTKRNLAYRSGLTFIVIPCWWDGNYNSLEATIQFQRPDLIEQSNHLPIAPNPPQNYFKTSEIPDVGELMLASFPNDTNFNRTIEKNTWWMGEKYDGIRCCWNPVQNQLYNRSGRIIIKNDNFALPNIFVDGELWFGRGKFSLTHLFNSDSEIIQSSHWSFLRMICFDVPSFEFRHIPFEKRYEVLIAAISRTDPFNIVAPRVALESTKHLAKSVESIIGASGEGVILRKVRSLYEHGRNVNLIKLKAVQKDREAVVIAKRDDGSVQLKLPENTMFIVAKESIQVPNLSIGDIVSFFYEIHARRDVPVSPKIYRIRTDVNWDDVVKNYENELRFLNDKSNFVSQLPNRWTPKNMRMHLEKFARKRNLDPLLSETWYSISQTQIKKSKAGKNILRKFNGSYFDALQHLFPEVKLDKQFFQEQVSHSIKNRRQFFEQYAKENGFDPYNHENWFYLSKKDIATSQEGNAVLNAKGGYFKNLKTAFPELDIDSFHQYSWKEPSNRRKFFEKYANDNGFDPLNADSWYRVARESIIALKGGERVLKYHSGSLPQALVELFPEIDIDKSKFPVIHKYGTKESRRIFFEKFALDNNFDPRIAANWYAQTKEKILAMKGAVSVLAHHNHRLSHALIDLFPEFNFDESRFSSKQMWTEPWKRREFFEKYAKDNDFDPLVADVWYNQTFKDLVSYKSARTVFAYYQGDFRKALVDLFPEVIFDLSRFRNNALDKVRRRQFFEMYAWRNKFDPHIGENWYNQSISNIMAHWGSHAVLQHYGNSLYSALVDLFPHIGLEKEKLSKHVYRRARNSKN